MSVYFIEVIKCINIQYVWFVEYIISISIRILTSWISVFKININSYKFTILQIIKQYKKLSSLLNLNLRMLVHSTCRYLYILPKNGNTFYFYNCFFVASELDIE